MDQFRIEKDSMGEVKVPNEKYWGAQTERSYENFKIGIEKMPVQIVRAFALLKGACAEANRAFGKLDDRRADAIIRRRTRPLRASLTAISLSSSGRRARVRSRT